ncbi:MAG: glucose-1-phosphate adenylyltransferase [Saprospiraceae bacterium]
MICLILGGGVGSRLYPLTDQRSKPAVPIGGKYRLIDIPISNCINSGVKRMFVLTQYNSASLNQHIKNTYHFDVFNPGFVDILAAEQTPSSDKWYQGTADAVRQSMHHLANHDHDYVLILSGDHLYQMDFEQFAKSHIEKKADISIATIPCNAKDASGFGIMKVNGEGIIESFIEKPKPDVLDQWKSEMPEEDRLAGRDYLASMGIYIFNRKALTSLFEENPDATDFGKEILPKAIETGKKVSSFQFNGYWTDIGTISSFFESNIALTSDVPEFNLFDNSSPVYTRARMLPPSKMFGARLDHAVIADGCIVHAETISKSVIGIRSRIGRGTKISNTIMMGADYYQTIEEMISNGEIPMGVGNDCVIDHAIIDKNGKIGDNVTIQGGSHLEDTETDTYCIRDGIVVVKKGATIPSGTVIG